MEYRDRAAFYIVYIEEAHPIDAWQVEDNLEDDVLVMSTISVAEPFGFKPAAVETALKRLLPEQAKPAFYSISPTGSNSSPFSLPGPGSGSCGPDDAFLRRGRMS